MPSPLPATIKVKNHAFQSVSGVTSGGAPPNVNDIVTAFDSSGGLVAWFPGAAQWNQFFTTPIGDNNLRLGRGVANTQFLNDAAGTANKLFAILTSSGTVKTALTSSTGGVVGPVLENAGTSGTCSIVLAGMATVTMDGSATAGHYVQLSTTTAGQGHDAGATYPTSGQVLGRVLSLVSGSDYLILVFGPEDEASSGGGGAATSTTITITNDAAGTANKLFAILTASGTVKTALTSTTGGALGVVTSGGGTSGSATITVLGVATVTMDGSATVGHYVQLSTTTAGQGHDVGTTYPTSGQVLGMVLANVSGSDYSVLIYSPDIEPPAAPGTGFAGIAPPYLLGTDGNYYFNGMQMTPPGPGGGWTHLNFASSSPNAVVTVGTYNDMTLTTTGDNVVQGLEKTAGVHTYTFAFMCTGMGSIPEFGIWFRNTSNDKVTAFIVFAEAGEIGVAVNHWTNSTTQPGANTHIAVSLIYGPLLWLQIVNDGTNITYNFSSNGTIWSQFYTETIASFLGTVNNVGWGMTGDTIATYRNLITCLSYKQT